MRYGMVIDIDRCVGCHACVISCRAEWEIPTQYTRNWVHRLGPSLTSQGLASTYYPGLCNHCEKPPCVPVCPADKVSMTMKDSKTGKTVTMDVAATWKDPFNGTVQIDYERCIGCGACRDACPYHARYINTELADDTCLGKADKCTYCMPRVAEGLEPACVQTCLARARIFGDLDDPQSEIAQYVQIGAVGLTSAAVQIGPNGLYFGSKKADMELLMTTSAPKELPKVSSRRTALDSLRVVAKRQLKDAGLLALGGMLLVKKMSEQEEK